MSIVPKPLGRIAVGARIVVCLAAATMAASAQETPPAEPPQSELPQSEPPQSEAPKADAGQEDPPPSLDDLLGIGADEETKRAQEIAREQAEAELDRKLLEQEINDAFRAAIERMQFAADLLDVEFDPGLGTQRVQEEIVAKLDQLIDAAQKSPQSSSSSSSSSSQSQQQQGQDPGQRGQQEGDQQQQGDQRQEGPAGESTEGEPPPGQDAQIGGVLEENRTEWGSLPERIRSMLLQGRQERFSSMYEELTREYYRRLAEDGS